MANFDPSQYEEYLKQLQTTPAPEDAQIDPSKYGEYLNMLKGTPAPEVAPIPATVGQQVTDAMNGKAPLMPANSTSSDSVWHPPMALANAAPKNPAPIPEPTMQAAPAMPQEIKGVDFGDQSDRPKLTDALSTQNNMNLIAGLGKSADQIGQAIAGTKREENPVYNDIQKQAAAVPGQYEKAKEDEKSDPNSQISKGFRSYVVDQLGIPVQGNPSAADLSAVAPYLFKNFEARLAEKGKLEAKKLDVESKQEIAKDKIDESARWHDLVATMKHDNADAANEKDATKRQATTLHNTQTFLESSRNLPDVRQALLDKYNIGKAAAIMKGKDLNSLSSNEVALLVDELGKIAKGGVSTHNELQAISPSTLTGYLRKEYSKLANEPIPANAGAFLKQYQTYLNELKSNAEDTISKKVRRVIETNKKDMGDENYAKLQEQYADMLNPEGMEPARTTNSATPGSAASKAQTVIQNGHTYTLNPQTGQYE